MKLIKKYVNEIIQGKDKNLEKLKTEVKNFFKGKTQKGFDKLAKKEVNLMVFLRDILFKENLHVLWDIYSPEIENKKLTEIGRALLDYALNKGSPKKYIWKEISKKYNKKEFLKFAKIIADENIFDAKEFYSIIGWLVLNPYFGETECLENPEKDLRLEIVFSGEDNETTGKQVILLIIGNKKHQRLINEINKIFNKK